MHWNHPGSLDTHLVECFVSIRVMHQTPFDLEVMPNQFGPAVRIYNQLNLSSILNL